MIKVNNSITSLIKGLARIVIALVFDKKSIFVRKPHDERKERGAGNPSSSAASWSEFLKDGR